MKLILGAVFALLPVVAFWIFASDPGSIDVSTFSANAEHYPEAVERLESTSQTLVTITLATLGAAGLLLTKTRNHVTIGGGISVFATSIAALYYATKLGYSAALTLAADQGDITRLVSMLEQQALAALISGIAVGLMVVFGGKSEFATT